MALFNVSPGAVAFSIFVLPIVAYLYYTRSLQSKLVGPLPPPNKITKLFIYPIKSCHGISVDKANLLPTGLDLDRQWMWVSYPDYKFLTIRNLAKMTLIRPSYNAEKDTLTITAPAPSSGDEKLHFEIPAHPTADWLGKNTEVVESTIWKTTTTTNSYSTDLTGPFNAFFSQEVRLVYKNPYSDTPRGLVSNGAPQMLGRTASTCFPDLMPILVGSEKSLQELNSRLKAAEDMSIDVSRFRPNILVDGSKPWDEDRWKTLRINSSSDPSPFWKKWTGMDGLTLDVTQRCARCHVPNVDPESGEEHKRQPWDTLMEYRRVDEGITYKPCFGMLCVPRGDGGVVQVGDGLEVMSVTDKHRYIVGM